MTDSTKDPERYWFTNLNKTDKKYIKEHPDPSHMIYYLQRGLKFDHALRLGYVDIVKEDMEINKNLTVATWNVKTNLLL
tara:strand:+ start:193 stop:429 length:237 start_codon:yes stop_codon:yes gene_type:complete